MATAKQTCAIIDDVLRLPENTSRWHADRLRGEGLLRGIQGRPEQIDSAETATLLLAVLIGTTNIRPYLAMTPISRGTAFAETLANFIDAPNDLLELRIDAAAPGATLTFRGDDNGVRTSTFATAERHARPAFDREIRVGPEIFVRLANAIRNAPEVRAGRRRLSERYETAVKF
ncbi:hypothetical protein [Pararhizobium gei]|uniref:hypothetical protein n=1 Tax=Pararhizobium gei TaxID=1395951 RepID=UPI0023DC944F|nr:hypothetical protein [Rhizobium gei]